MKSKIVVHGGAGSWEENLSEAEGVLSEAAELGFNQLDGGAPAIDAVEKAINHLEDSGLFNAGKGADLQLDGKVRLDASVMTSSLDCGAVCSIEEIKHAVSVARKVMEETHHVMLSGIHATEFAEEMGFEREDLKNEGDIEVWRGLWEEVKGLNFKEKVQKLREMDLKGTVGCVALDKDGELAAGTSTGGRNPELAGRVGDTPVIGSGTYCNPSAAVSATGVGEAIIRSVLSRRCCEYVERGTSVEKAAKKSINYLEENTGRSAGLIVLDRNGNHSLHYNTKKMPTCSYPES